MKKIYWAWLLIFGIVVLDQVLKFGIKLNMSLGEEFIVIPDWFRIHFVENEGMAFGWSFGDFWGKLFLTLFRLAIVPFFAVYMYRLIKKGISGIIVVAMSMIIAGALGNIIDSVFYGKIFSASSYDQVSVLFPQQGGYAPILFGKVVDMFYFPLFSFKIPVGFPFWGGAEVSFFDYIFNIADASIFIGFVLLLVFYKKLNVFDNKNIKK